MSDDWVKNLLIDFKFLNKLIMFCFWLLVFVGLGLRKYSQLEFGFEKLKNWRG